MIRLIALDLDQTLFGHDLTIAPRVADTVGRAVRAGLHVTIATGREAKLASRFAMELGLTTPIIAAQGGCIYDFVNNQVLHNVRLDPAVLPMMISAAERHGWMHHFESFDRLYFPEHSKHPAALFELIRYSNWVRVGNLLHDMPEPPQKMIVTVETPEQREQVRQEMQEEFGDQLSVISSHPHLLEALPKSVDKAHGLTWLARHIRVNQTEVLAIGDSEADLPMLRWAGVGVAMGNATEAVKAAAAWVAPSLAEHGAAVAIEKFALQSGA